MQSQCERFIYNVGLCDKENLYVSCHSLTISKGAFCNLSVLLTGNLWKEMHGQRCNKSLGLLLFNNYMAVRYATLSQITKNDCRYIYRAYCILKILSDKSYFVVKLQPILCNLIEKKCCQCFHLSLQYIKSLQPYN